MSYTSLVHRYVAASFDKQLQLADLVGTLDWYFDNAGRLLSFADRYEWHVQILGTESDEANAWLWAWANHASNIPRDLLRASLRMRQAGEQQQIPEFTTPELPLGKINGHSLALIASGVCRANAYYRGPHKGGAVFFLIKDENFPKHDVVPLARIASVFPQVISSLEIPDHRLALMGYLEHFGLVAEIDADRVVVKEGGEPVLIATFDERSRLIRLERTFSN
jgi:hypothetical protein